ncbi:MAG: hypothetical protein ACSHXJ_02630 [Marinomonas colpomeniae]
MYKVLILDDNIPRAKKIKKEIDGKFKNCITILHCESINEAHKKLMYSNFELLIIDVKLPKKKGDIPNERNTFNFIKKIQRSIQLNEPENIIGITSEISEIKLYKEEFESYCSVVLNASSFENKWLDKVISNIEGKIFFSERKNHYQKKSVITVHGIRTYGEWQKNLNSLLIESGIKNPIRLDYQIYNAFTLFSKKETRKNINNLKKLILSIDNANIYLVGHSFGSHLIVNAVKELIESGKNPPISAIIISGSVIKTDFNWSVLTENNIEIINDCGTNDYTLYLSEIFVPDLGMTGKIGINSTSKNIRNRFIKGGHSDFFKRNFIEDYWIPIITKDHIIDIDERKANILINGYFEKFILKISKIKKRFK